MSAGQPARSQCAGARGLSWWPPAGWRLSQTGLQLSLRIWCGKTMGSYLSVPAYFTSRDPFR